MWYELKGTRIKRFDQLGKCRNLTPVQADEARLLCPLLLPRSARRPGPMCARSCPAAPCIYLPLHGAVVCRCCGAISSSIRPLRG
jgi:hypothetical protein